MPHDEVEARMQALVQSWEESSDQRSIFLKCYLMMTRNMHLAIQLDEFRDPDWVDHLVNHFAGYYFMALEAYEQDPAAAPPVWQLAHRAARDPDLIGIQKLLLGINAHINYDLALAVVDMLKPEWGELSDGLQEDRYVDYCHVNEVIGSTIDEVQDQVLEQVMPAMELIDTLFGPLDEKVISSLLGHWREKVWHYAEQLLKAMDVEDQVRLRLELERDAIKIGHTIGFTDRA
ncbi:MAG: hypothetical protein A2W35_01130 [Chloroflexi bacterium RBG_16_57_11]|nr:MAG: hypothetical protein A2W35_01130 [Chloroflexi bacterium RBG_16_57_11]